MFLVLISTFCELRMCETKKKKEDGKLWVFLKFQNHIKTVSLAYNTS